MIEVRSVRQLDVFVTHIPGRIPFLTAASGLVRVGRYWYVIADDENYLGVFQDNEPGPGNIIPIFGEELPVDKKERKKAKPDFEALTYLPPNSFLPHASLLVTPSGSKLNRYRAAIIPLAWDNSVSGPAQEYDLTFLFDALLDHLHPPNIESVALLGSDLILIHRGNKEGHGDTLLKLPSAVFLDSLFSGRPLKWKDFVSHSIELESINGVRFTITDASTLDDERMVFTAVAERTNDSYDDGPCLGAGIGIVDSQGQVSFFDEIQPPKKIEGVFAQENQDRIQIWLVNDEDNPSRPSELLTAEIKRP